VILDLTPKQATFVEAALSGRFLYLLFGGAIRGGKTVCALSLLFILCRVFPGSRWAIVRKDLPTLKRNTIPSFNRTAPRPFVGELNKSTWTATCSNGSQILFFAESAKEDPDFDRWKGLEVNGFALEEMNELTEGGFNMAIQRAGSWTVAGRDQPPPLVVGTCNPARGFVKRRFYDPWKAGTLAAPYYYLPSKITDNPHNPPAYVESLNNLPPADFARFVEGDWDRADDPDQLIAYEWITQAMNLEPERGNRSLGVDVARSNSPTADDTTIADLDGLTLAGLEYHHGIPTDRTSELVAAKINGQDGRSPCDPARVKVDVVGVGAGVADNLVRDGFDVVPFVAGAKAAERTGDDGDGSTFYRFANARSQAWWEYRELLRLGQAPIAVDDPRLFEDLTAPHYSVSGDKVITVESKDRLRRRIHRSTDAADAVIMAYWEPPEEEDTGPAPAFV